jgi:CYTH domain-containing protein
MAVDEFQAELDGLIMAQAEFETPVAFPMPDFAARKVTDGPRFTSAYLVSNGLPTGLSWVPV